MNILGVPTFKSRLNSLNLSGKILHRIVTKIVSRTNTHLNDVSIVGPSDNCSDENNWN